MPEHFEHHGGAVIGTAIDKFTYLSVMRFPSELFDYTVRLAYRRVECVADTSFIEHRPFQQILKYCGIERDIEINVSADLPSFSGLGTSSCFTVGLLKVLNAYLGKHIGAAELTKRAIHIEREVLQEAVGCQDQAFASYGGFNLIEFSGKDRVVVERVMMSSARMDELNRSLMLFFTGITRRAQDIEKNKIKNIAALADNLKRMRLQVDQAHAVLTGGADLSEFGVLLDKAWKEKRALDPKVSNEAIDSMYQRATAAGALGGKLLGAGGGGFLLFFVPPERQDKVREALARFHQIHFSINAPGSSVIHS